MGEPPATKKRLHGAEVHVYKAGRLYRKDTFFSTKRPCSVSLRGRTLSVYEAARDENHTYNLRNSKLMIQTQSKKIVIELKSKERLSFFAADDEDLTEWTAVLADSIHWKLQRYYDVGEELGQGAFATVSKGVCKRTGEVVAIKIIDKTTCSDEDFKYLQREIDVAKRLHHPNVVRTIDLFESGEKVFLVLEYVGGGTLQSFRENQKSLNEHQARNMMRDIFKGIEYIHGKKVAHRDIKPENLLCTTKDFPTTVKLMDFGLARNLDLYVPKAEDRYDCEDNVRSDELMSTPVGTPKFVAPEVLRCTPYGKEIDLFACGVVMYWLLCGYTPFDHPDIERLVEQIKRTEFDFPEADWACISEEAKELISRLLSQHPPDRPTATQALQFAWFCVPEELHTETRTVHGENDDNEIDSIGAFPRPSRTGSMLYQLSRASEIDDVDDITEVIQLTSEGRISGNGSTAI